MAVLADRSVGLLRLGLGLVLRRLGAGVLRWEVGEGRQWAGLVYYPSCADEGVLSSGEITIGG